MVLTNKEVDGEDVPADQHFIVMTNVNVSIGDKI